MERVLPIQFQPEVEKVRAQLPEMRNLGRTTLRRALGGMRSRGSSPPEVPQDQVSESANKEKRASDVPGLVEIRLVEEVAD